ncbi:hypothetical protein H4S01_001739 [Coemansia sp. RSA 2610]|nr:hypothetical protein H4S01_001739 [Coemansia sp. RSA 2610]
MLLPEFDIGDEGFAMDLLPQSHVLAGLGSSAGKHACPDGEADGSGPLRKRLRTLGRAAVDLAVDYAPGWARSALQGQRVADTHGQHQGSGDDAAATVDQLKELMDNSARRIGRVAVIGVHGWFPMRMLQMLAGEPTGRSEKFCEMMRDALTEYLRENHGVVVDAGDISLFPLVGEGRIQDRVELLLSQITDTEGPEPAAAADARGAAGAQAVRAAEALMPPRAERAAELQAADTVFVVTHSQGTAVSALLVERLLELGLLEPARQRVAMLAMAGIGHGPLVHLRDNVVIKYIESAAARELFELMDPSSALSQRFVAALSTALHRGVRVVCVGSWVDEVVPLYSAIVQGVSHPGVLRAVYIDAPHYADDFLTALIVFALRLRNAGIYDHGLLVHVSGVVAGSLWGHWGHSTVYGEPAVYKLAVKWLLFSTAAKPQPAPREHMSYRPLNAAEPLNPFFLPWIMRTLWDDPAVQSSRSLRAELQRLAALFDVWTPETKAGRELRYRLEPVRAGP